MASDCLFCRIIAGEEPSHQVMSDDCAVAVLDVRPLFPGHVLVLPRRHCETLADLPADQVGPLFGRVRLMARAVADGMGAEGTFVAMNNRVSQSVPHLHVHVVPRRRKDGLRGFFWPRTGYDSDEHASAVAQTLRGAYQRAVSSEEPTPPVVTA